MVEKLRREYEMACEQAGENSAARQQAAARYFGYLDTLLDRAGTGPLWLQIPDLAQLVLDCLRHPDGQDYQLLAACVMPNHWHAVLITPKEPRRSLTSTLQQFAAHTARKANALLGRQGRFWQRETYDHLIRNPWEGGLAKAILYVRNNPVKAGFCAYWADWPFTYVAPDWQGE